MTLSRERPLHGREPVSAIDASLEVIERGAGPQVLLIHGALADSAATWKAQAQLARRWRLLMVERPGFGASPAPQRSDWISEGRAVAGLLSRPAHLLGHSYGSLVALVAASEAPQNVLSLTLVEPPGYALLPDDAEATALIASIEQARITHAEDPRAALLAFLDAAGIEAPVPEQLPPALLAGVRLFIGERLPWQGEPPFAAVAAAPFPKLVVCCVESPLRRRVGAAVAEAIGARVVELAGGHNLQRSGEPFNVVLEEFLADAQRCARQRRATK